MNYDHKMLVLAALQAHVIVLIARRDVLAAKQAHPMANRGDEEYQDVCEMIGRLMSEKTKLQNELGL